MPRIAQRRVLGYEIVIQQDRSPRIVTQGAIGVVRLEVDDLHRLCPLSHDVRAGADLFPLVFLPLAHIAIDLSRLRLLEVDTQVLNGVGRGRCALPANDPIGNPQVISRPIGRAEDKLGEGVVGLSIRRLTPETL